MAEGRLEGKVAIVTGGSRGLGASVVRRFAAEGASVLVTDILDDAGQALAAELENAGHSVRYQGLDVRDEASWDAAFAAAESAFGPVDILFNNAGFVRAEGVGEETLEGFKSLLDVNLVGVFLGMRAAVRTMADRGGSIINTSSTWGLVGANGGVAYHASKGGVTVMTKNAAVDYAERGVRVNSIHPGPMQTQVAEDVGEEGMAVTIARTPMKRVASPDEVADIVVYLASDEASFTTGAGFVVDGGYTAW